MSHGGEILFNVNYADSTGTYIEDIVAILQWS